MGDSWLRVGSLKLFADGALGTQTAWMLDPYPGRGGYRGIPTLERSECEREIVRAARGGIASAVHAIGDAANRMVLDSYAATEHEWRAARPAPADRARSVPRAAGPVSAGTAWHHRVDAASPRGL